MEWIDKILREHTDDEGKLNIEEASKAINSEFPKQAVPKEDFNAKVRALSEAADQIAELQKEIDPEAQKKLEEQITTLQEELGEARATNEELKKEYAIKKAFTEAGARDADYLIYKAGGLEAFKMEATGEVEGLADLITKYQEDESTSYLFKGKGDDKPQGNGYKPAGGQNPGAVNPFTKEHYNLTEQGRLLKESPEQARALAAAAGVTI